jgi:signal transduction histidine kinase
MDPRSPDHRTAGLLAIADAISSEVDFRTLLKILAQKAAQICGADRGSIYLLRDGLVIPAMAQYASGVQDVGLWRQTHKFGPLPLEDFRGFERALDEGTPIVFTDPASVLPSYWIDTFHIRSGLIIPLRRGDRRVGVIHLNNSESAGTFDAADVELGRAIGIQLALVIDNARLVAETRARLHDTETLLNVSRTINSTLDLMEVVRRIARAAANAVGANSAGLYLLTGDDTLQPLAGYHIPKGLLQSAQHARLTLQDFREIADSVKHHRRSLWSEDVPADPRFAHHIFRQFPMQSVLITSVRAKSEVIGVLVCSWWRERRRFTDQELDLVEAIGTQAAIAIMNARLYAKAEELAVNRERVRVAHELHDRLSHTVFSVGLRLDWCLHHLSPGSPVYPKLLDVRREARSIMSQLRQLVYRLSPDDATGTELSARIRKLVADFEELSGIVVTYQERGDLTTLGARDEDVLLKVLHEGLANVVKHACARQVLLTLEAGDGAIRFELVDDGVGPPPDFSTARCGDGHYGLRQMVDRIEAVGGYVDLGPGGASGFRLRGSFPAELDLRAQAVARSHDAPDAARA